MFVVLTNVSYFKINANQNTHDWSKSWGGGFPEKSSERS